MASVNSTNDHGAQNSSFPEDAIDMLTVQRAPIQIEHECDLDSITQRNQTASPFLRLPAELRTQIYSYVLSGRGFTIEFGHPRRPYLLDFRDSQKNGPSLPRTCRQINSEMSTIPRTRNTLSVSHPLMLQEPFKHSGMLKTVTSLVLNTKEHFTHYWFDNEFLELDDCVKWWNETSLTFARLPLLETVQVFVVAQDWESTVHNPGGTEWKAERAVKLAYIRDQFAIWSAFVEECNPGINVTFGLRHTGIRKRRRSLFAPRHRTILHASSYFEDLSVRTTKERTRLYLRLFHLRATERGHFLAWVCLNWKFKGCGHSSDYMGDRMLHD